MRRFTSVFLLAFVFFGSIGCLFLDDDEGPLEMGYVQCDDNVCQPGTYCSSVTLGICSEGCVSNANCLAEEQCLKEKSTDRKGSCIPSKRPPCCE